MLVYRVTIIDHHHYLNLMSTLRFILLLVSVGALPAQSELKFNRDIRPILSDNCFQCHGPDQNQRKANLRLDLREVALAKKAIVPNDPDGSELMKRITHEDPDERMPPLDSGHSLTERERDLLQRWISDGAQYEPHWSFIPLQRPVLPPTTGVAQPQNEIDHFTFARMDGESLRPSPPASRQRLIRRLSFDLTGLPPTLAEIDAFVADNSPLAAGKLVDQLLAREAFGEHMAVSWLDAARYADTNGYNNDTPRYNWRWRDWVIGAFNRNLPFDQFLTEQLAGDLIPENSTDQKLATGFNRNHNVTSEGGIIDEEYRLEYVADRVHTTATVFMALSLRCARCHDHKFDPITQKEYYAFSAFFNQVPETGYHKEHVGNPNPVISAPTRGQRATVQEREAELANLATQIRAHEQLADQRIPAWERRIVGERKPEKNPIAGLLVHYPLEKGEVQGKTEWVPGKIGKALKLDGKSHLDQGDTIKLERDQAFSYGAWVFPSAAKPMNILSRMNSDAAERGFDLTFENGPVSLHLIHHWPANAIKVQTKATVSRNRWTHIFATYDGSSKAAGIRIYFDGLEQALEVQKDALTNTIVADVGFRIGRRTNSIPFVGMIDEMRIYSRALEPTEVSQLAGEGGLSELLAIDANNRTEEQREIIRSHYLTAEDPKFSIIKGLHAAQTAKLAEFKKSLPTAMVMEDQEKPRDTFVLMRGDYAKRGEKVAAGVPAMFPPLPKSAPRNRLAMAHWLTDPKHPLTARVAVNRLWFQMFGNGIVDTLEDFGSQGAWPTHPDLLDWLAVELIESGWDIKAMLKLITTSATYQQSARASPELLKLDPGNRLLARGPRFRMTAEMIRDHALAISGLLHRQLGGESVKPYQPPGLWTEVIVADDSYSGGAYKQDSGSALYRRGVYTWWKRTCPPPALNTFDAPDREFCTIRRTRTNTPLQALVMLNDPTFVEAARALAGRMMSEAGPTDEARATFAFRLATSRPPKPAELEILATAFRKNRARLAADPDRAPKLLAVGESKSDPAHDATELAAWMTVASMILNLDESISR